MPVGSGRWPRSPTRPSASVSTSPSSAARNRRVLVAARLDPELPPQEPLELRTVAEPARLALEPVDLGRPAHRPEQLHELRQRRERDPRLAVDRRPADVRDR